MGEIHRRGVELSRVGIGGEDDVAGSESVVVSHPAGGVGVGIEPFGELAKFNAVHRAFSYAGEVFGEHCLGGSLVECLHAIHVEHVVFSICHSLPVGGEAGGGDLSGGKSLGSCKRLNRLDYLDFFRFLGDVVVHLGANGEEILHTVGETLNLGACGGVFGVFEEIFAGAVGGF